ncbi:hypothetical protein KUV64_22100 [Mameliella alba]|uniref:hypothetical protein n=1 Tax=Mameliella alba TaxID=561184 RepID=UPI001C96B921|nr:hypothetical protein [Mameliella alba]MBY6121831.1 hypothetical protein [Mameliella alba]
MFIDSTDQSIRAGQGSGRNLAPRPSGENPKDARCPLHLQRVCGTCAHYCGALHPADGEPGRARCASLEITMSRRRNAWACRRWTRKNGGA